MTKLFSLVAGSLCAAVMAGGASWDHIGPHNIFDDKNGMGEAGTLASAASPAAHPNIIYAGGSNNGASSGILKTVDGGKHWTRNSNGLWDTRIKGVFAHPDCPLGNWVFAGTESGIYESKDGAASWTFMNETKDFGNVLGFEIGTIDAESDYVIASSTAGILAMPVKGGTWKLIQAWPVGETVSNPVSMYSDAVSSTVFICCGGWQGGPLYSWDSVSKTWSAPLGDIKCANVAVDPNDSNYLIYSKAGEYQAYESHDAGLTSKIFPANPPGVFYVMIDDSSNLYTATQAGAFVSRDQGKSWSAYHVIVNERSGGVMDRVAHDYQRIISNFQGKGIAFPSDQGLHIVDGKSPNLTSAVGDLTNCISINLAVSPGETGSRNLVTTMWDWSAVASWDDGATWPSWDLPTEKDIQNPNIGEGGGTLAFGKSGHVLMWHRSSYWHSCNGGKNLTIATVPESGSLTGIDYFRQQGSRSEPSGTVFALADTLTSEKKLLVSEDFGVTWITKTLPDSLQGATQVTVDPTADVVFVVAPDCLASSADKGTTWGSCTTPLVDPDASFTGLAVINSDVMFLLRDAVPLRTTDGGKTWTELTSAAPLFKYAAPSMSVSWSGKTLVLHGVDHSAIERGAAGAMVFKSINNGDSWTDETGDIVTISLNEGVWYDTDFYMTSSGEGIIVKRNFE